MDSEEIKRNLIEQFAEFGASSTGGAVDSLKGNKVERKRKGKKKKSLQTHEEKSLDVTKRQAGTVADSPIADKLASKKKPRPPPTVIVFEEPGKKKNVKNNEKESNQGKKRNREDANEDDIDFTSIAEEVKEFGMTGFSRKERKKYEQQKAQALGAKPPKGLKMPYKIVMYAAKVRKQREIEEREQKREMGIIVKKKSEAKPNTNGSLGWWIDKSKGVNPTVGKFKGGMYHIEKPILKKRRK